MSRLNRSKKQRKSESPGGAGTRSVQPAPPDAAIVALQHSAGNRAVGQWLQSGGEGQQTAGPEGSSLSLQTKSADGASADRAEQQADLAAEQAAPEAGARAQARILIVDDDAPVVGPGQMRKSDFLGQLYAGACSAAESAMAGTMWSALGCPYIDRWFACYADKSAQYLEKAIQRYAPEALGASSAHEYVGIATARLRRGLEEWKQTGEVTGVPEGLDAMPDAGLSGSVSGLAGSALSAASDAASSLGSMLFKRRGTGAKEEQDPEEIRNELGGGQSLDAGARQKMQAAYGVDFSGVRVHTDATAQELNDDFDARAFTVGSDIAFGPGEYRPGTPAGDALIAHELAHVVQQRGEPSSKDNQGQGALEAEADIAGVGAAASAWGMAKTGLGTLGSKVMPRLRSGLQLQRCNNSGDKSDDKKASGPTITVVGHGASAEAVTIAQQRADEIIGGLSAPGASGLKGAKVELHIIPHDKKLTDLPEWDSLKGTKTFDGRDYDELRGVGGTKVGDKITYAVAEEELVAIAGQPTAYALGFVAGHESGHIVEQYGLTDKQKEDLTAAFDARTAAGGPWLAPDWYTKSSTGEYFAQSSAAYFGHPYSASEEDKTSYTRKWLEDNDPLMYELLKKVYK